MEIGKWRQRKAKEEKGGVRGRERGLGEKGRTGEGGKGKREQRRWGKLGRRRREVGRGGCRAESGWVGGVD